jgi:hypothetical protein
MAYVNVYPTRINWENEPSINTPINDVNLNKIDYAVYEHDRTFANWDTTKANQSDLLLSVKTIEYDDDTGVFVFTWQNGTTKTVDLNIEKIPVSFSMNAQGVITMTTDDGTQYTADVGALIKTYTFTDSTEIDFTVTTDQSGNKTITAGIVDGSITGTKLQPNYLADCTAAKTAAENAETGAEGSAEDAEAWAVGERGGVPVDPTDPTYHNNSKYWSEQANVTTLSALTDTDIDNPADGQVLTYDGATSKWENKTPAAGGGSKITITTSELSLIGTTATLTDGVTTLSADFDNSGKAVFEGVTMTGTLTVTATNGVDTATKQITIQYYGNYTFVIAFFSATITITFPYTEGGTCTVSDGVSTLTATTSPMAFVVPNTGTWVATCTLDGQSKTQSFVITTDGQTESHTFQYGTINLTVANEFRGLTLTCSSGGTTISKVAPSTGNTMAFYPPSTGTWEIVGIYSGVPYSSGSITVSSLSTPVSALLQMNVTLTVTLYGAKEDTISFTDSSGAKTEVFASGQSSKSVSITIPPSGMSITFTSSVAKNPDDLTEYYSKTVTVTSGTTEVKCMPDNALYWYGYESSDLEDCTSANGWSANTGFSLFTPTHNTRTISANVNSSTAISGIASKTTKSDITAKVIIDSLTKVDGNSYCYLGNTATKNTAGDTTLNITASGVYSQTISSGYLLFASARKINWAISALWYE